MNNVTGNLGRAALLLIAATLLGACAEETIAHQQIEREANRMVRLLAKQGIDATKTKDPESRELVFNIMVAADAKVQALDVLDAHNLPVTEKPDSAVMAENSGMIPTAQQERIKQEVGATGDITNRLRKIPGVVDVHTVVSIPEDNPLRDINEAPPRAKASVIIVYRGEGKNPQPPLTVEDVQRFVQARFDKIKSSEVSVLMVPSSSAMISGGSGVAAAPMIDPGQGCVKKERVLGIDVCLGNKKKVINIVIGSIILAGILAGLTIVQVLQKMRYRKELTRLTAQFERVKR